MTSPNYPSETEFLGILPYTVPLGLAFNDEKAIVQPRFRNSATSDPAHRIALPAGETRISLTVSRMRGFPALWVIPKDGSSEFEVEPSTFGQQRFYTVGLTSEAEIEIRVNFTPNTNDRIISQLAVTIMPNQLYKPATT